MAWLQRDRSALVVWGVNGTRMYVEFAGRSGDAPAVHPDVHVLANPTDPDTWVAVH